MNIVGLVGFADSGKGTASRILIEQGWQPIAFADALKDALAVVFGWSRHLLEGDTGESRKWRETVDPWWAAKLSIPHFTPRWAMQNVGTDVFRRHFHDDLWVFRVERSILDTPRWKAGIVLTDIRFHNEGALARVMGGKVVRIKRGDEPAWFEVAHRANCSEALCERIAAATEMKEVHKVHESEWRWIGMPLDATIKNDGTVDHLQSSLLGLVT